MTTTPPSSFRRFGQAKPAEPVAAAKEPEVLEPIVEKPVKTTPPPTPKAAAPAPKVEQQRAVSLFKGGGAGAANAVSAFVQVADEKPQFDLFPVVTLLGGDNGGLFDPAKHMPDDLKKLLPSGRNPFPAVVLGYRIGVLGYRIKSEGGKGDRPVWSGIIPAHDNVNVDAAARYCKNYQYTKGINKGKYDFATSGAGHPKPFMAVLTYLPEQNMLVEIRTPAHFNSMERSGREMAAHFREDGSLEAFPCEIEPCTTQEGEDAPKPWKIHHLVFKAMKPADKAASKKAFDAWFAAAEDDAELVDAYNKWITGEDRPLTPDILEYIATGIRI